MPEITTNNNSPLELSIKRFYVPGTIIKDTCPNCKTLIENNLDDHYIYYPKFNEKINYPFYCNECEHEWNVGIIITIQISLAQ